MLAVVLVDSLWPDAQCYKTGGSFHPLSFLAGIIYIYQENARLMLNDYLYSDQSDDFT